MNRKQFISKFWVLHGNSEYKVSQTRYYVHVFWIANYWKMYRKGNGFESCRRVYEGSTHITTTGFEEHSRFWKQTLEWIPENVLLIHESGTQYERLFTTITEFFFGNDYFKSPWWWSWTLDCCKARLNHTILWKNKGKI